MKLRSIILITAAGAALVTSRPALAQESTSLPRDAEHYGALFDSSRQITFYNSGRLMSGWLKSDYTLNGATYEAGTLIRFHEDGRLLTGVLKNDTIFQNIMFLKGEIAFHDTGAVRSGSVGAGYSDANLVVPVAASLSLDPQGRVTAFSSTAGVPKFNILGRSVRNGAQVYYDPVRRAYRILASTAAEPMIIARFVTARNRFGTATEIQPVVVPVNTNFQLYTDHPVLLRGGQDADIWSPPERFVFNGWDFGMNPVQLYVRDMRLLGIGITQDLTVGGHSFKAHSKILFDDLGRIVPPGDLQQFP